MEKGFITLSRSITDNFLWNCEPFSRGQAWVDLLLKANYKSNRMIIKNGTFIDVERGQVASGISKISNDWNWDRRKVKRFINELEKQEMVQQKNVGNHTIITILNYEHYQNGTTNGTTNSTTNSTTNGTTNSTTNSTTNGTTFNKDNKEKNVNKENKENNYYSSVVERMESFAVQKFNEKFGTNYKKITTEFESIAHLYTEEEIMTAIDNAYLDDFWQDKATPLNIFKANNLEKLINTKPKITTANKLLAEQDIEW